MVHEGSAVSGEGSSWPQCPQWGTVKNRTHAAESYHGVSSSKSQYQQLNKPESLILEKTRETSKGLDWKRYRKGTWHQWVWKVEPGRGTEESLWFHGRKNFVTWPQSGRGGRGVCVWRKLFPKCQSFNLASCSIRGRMTGHSEGMVRGKF